LLLAVLVHRSRDASLDAPRISYSCVNGSERLAHATPASSHSTPPARDAIDQQRSTARDHHQTNGAASEEERERSLRKHLLCQFSMRGGRDKPSTGSSVHWIHRSNSSVLPFIPFTDMMRSPAATSGAARATTPPPFT